MNAPAAPHTPAAPAPASDTVTMVIDGKQVVVPKGINVIEAAKKAGIEIPHYCYHQHLSIAGNCRMCQVRVKGMPKMEIGCNLQVKEGMEVSTHQTSKEVADTQAAVLEFILINHPLDCTVCDQAGHCKLQDYHYEYNARPSRFLEEKEHKVKAQPLGPTVMLDGERCIMCTRCIRFCDEVTKTSELGMLNRGDKSVISVISGKELNNPLSGTVVDLCPVGALTHREWRFNTRIWFTNQTNSICPGCSTGCNVKVAERDGKVVLVKGRENAAVNKEWMCDEGRYGFDRFLPVARVTAPLLAGKVVALKDAIAEAKKITSGETAVFLSPDLLLEEYYAIKTFLDKSVKGARVAVAYRERGLTDVEKILVSPDYAANFRGAEFSGLVSGNLADGYLGLLADLKAGKFKNVLIVGDRGILAPDIDEALLTVVKNAQVSIAILTDAASPLAAHAKVLLPGRSILEKSGLLINRKLRIQYSDRVVPFVEGSIPEWRLFTQLIEACGGKLSGAVADREFTLSYIAAEPRLNNLSIGIIKSGGVDLAPKAA